MLKEALEVEVQEFVARHEHVVDAEGRSNLPANARFVREVVPLVRTAQSLTLPRTTAELDSTCNQRTRIPAGPILRRTERDPSSFQIDSVLPRPPRCAD